MILDLTDAIDHVYHVLTPDKGLSSEGRRSKTNAKEAYTALVGTRLCSGGPTE